MDDEIKNIEENEKVNENGNVDENGTADVSENDGGEALGHSDYKPSNRFDASIVHHLSGMYRNWFLDYASYSI